MSSDKLSSSVAKLTHHGHASFAQPFTSPADPSRLSSQAFADADFRARHSLSAINSINWARVLAQSVYYFWAYVQHLGTSPSFAAWTQDAKNGLATVLRCRAVSRSMGRAADRLILPPVTFVVPTGNFGNALSGYYARRMGLPIGKLVVATNANDIMHRFISGGDYSLRDVSPTLAPSMDIQLASNLERYLFHVAGGDAEAVKKWQAELATAKRIGSFPPAMLAQLQADFSSCAADDGVINDVIARYLAPASSSASSSSGDGDSNRNDDTSGPYALCPHTACGVFAAERLAAAAAASSDSSVSGTNNGQSAAGGAVIVLATAHPAKFAADTPSLKGLYGEVFAGSAEPRLAALAAVPTPPTIRPPLPPQLSGLGSKPRQAVRVRADVAEVKAVVDAMTTRR